MKQSKGQLWLKPLLLVLCAFFVLAGVMVAVCGANAEEAAVEVGTEQQLKQAVESAGSAKTTIKLTQDIELVESEVSIDKDQDITLDLNGYTLSRKGWVIVNWWGKLTLEDSSVEKTGTIADANTGTGTNAMGLVFNYGEMHSSVNYDVVYSSCVAVTNQLRLAGPDNTQYICNPSLTITGGTVKHRGTANNGVTLLETVDGNVTINDGTFITENYHGSNTLLIDVSSTYVYPPDYLDVHLDYGTDYAQDPDGGFMTLPAGQEKSDAAMEQLQPIVEAYDKHRESTVTINGGDFTSFDSKCGVFSVASKVKKCTGISCGTYSASWGSADAEDYNASVTITNGRWGQDLSGYVPEGKWMDLIEETTNDGKVTYYMVRDVDSSRVAAEVTIDNEVQARPYLNFTSAWNAAKLVAAEKRTVKLLKDSTAKVLSLTQVSGEMILDLNGHKLTIDPESASARHVDVSNSTNYPNTLVICDTSPEQDGVLEFSASKGVSSSSFFWFYTGNTKVRLESGTISQTGLVPASYKDYSTDDVTSSNDDYLYYMSLFKFGPTSNELTQYQNNYQGLVTIKGGNIISELNFGTADHIDATHPGVLVGYKAPNYNNNEFGLLSKENDKVPSKETMFVVDLEDYLADGSKSCLFSWDFDEVVSPKGLTSSGADGRYVVSKVSEKEFFILNSSAQKFEKLSQALKGAKQGDTVMVLQDVTLDESVTIDNGVTLNLNSTTNFTVTIGSGSLTLQGGAMVKYGTIIGDLTVAGDATLSKVHVTGNVSASAGTLTIDSGVYEGTVDIAGSDNAAVITGGSFKGSEISKLDKYFSLFLGAYIAGGAEYDESTLYEVKIAPNLAAQAWYKSEKEKGGDKTYEISSTDQWNYFALYVNSGADSFKGKTVKLTADLDFGGAPAGISMFSARAAATPFLPAGNATNAFEGSFSGEKDAGGSYTLSGIVAKEKLVGLFGYTRGVTSISNVTIRNSTFTVGNGYLDELNAGAGTLSGGALIGEGYDGTNQTNIELEGVAVDFDINGYSIFSGALLGHTWGNITVDGLKMTQSSVESNWKAGGLVGYYEGDFTLTNGAVSDVTVDTGDSFFAPGSIIGHANGANTTFEDCQINTPDANLVGAAYSGRSDKVVVQGSKTEIHCNGIGATGTKSVELIPSSDGENGFDIETSDPLPVEWFDFSQLEGGGIVERDENGKYNYSALNYVAAIYRGGDLVEEYTDLATAVEKAQDGDEIYVYAPITQNITVENKLTFVLHGFGFDGSAKKLRFANYSDYDVVIKDSSGTIMLKGEVTLDDVIVEGNLLNEGTCTLTYYATVTGNITNTGTLTIESNSKVNGTLTNSNGSITITGGTFTAPEIVSNPVLLKEFIQIEHVAIMGENAVIVKSLENVSAGEYIVTGSSKNAIDKTKIAAGYAYVQDEDNNYVITKLSEYNALLLQDLASSRDELLNKYIYSEASEEKLRGIYDRVEAELSSRADSLTMIEAERIVNSAIIEMNSVPVLNVEQEENAKALAEAKKDAKNELLLYAASKGLSLQDESVTNGLDAIETAAEESGITSALEAAKKSVDDVKAALDKEAADQQAAEEAARKLAEAKKAAENELMLYAASRGLSLQDESVTKGLDAIETAAEESGITSALEAAKKSVDDVKAALDKEIGDQQEQDEEARKLAEARKDAKNELMLYAASLGVSLKDGVVTNGLGAIDAAANGSGITSALESAKKSVDAAKAALDKEAADQQAAEEAARKLSEAKKDAKNELMLYAASLDISLKDSSVTNGLSAIEAAADESGITSALEAAKVKVDEAKTALDGQSAKATVPFIVIVVIEAVVVVALLVVLIVILRKKKVD